MLLLIIIDYRTHPTAQGLKAKIVYRIKIGWRLDKNDL